MHRIHLIILTMFACLFGLFVVVTHSDNNTSVEYSQDRAQNKAVFPSLHLVQKVLGFLKAGRTSTRTLRAPHCRAGPLGGLGEFVVHLAYFPSSSVGDASPLPNTSSGRNTGPCPRRFRGSGSYLCEATQKAAMGTIPSTSTRDWRN